MSYTVRYKNYGRKEKNEAFFEDPDGPIPREGDLVWLPPTPKMRRGIKSHQDNCILFLAKRISHRPSTKVVDVVVGRVDDAVLDAFADAEVDALLVAGVNTESLGG